MLLLAFLHTSVCCGEEKHQKLGQVIMTECGRMRQNIISNFEVTDLAKKLATFMRLKSRAISETAITDGKDILTPKRDISEISGNN